MKRGTQAQSWWLPACAGLFALAAVLGGSSMAASVLAAILALCTAPIAIASRRRRFITTRETVILVMFGLCNACSVVLRTVTAGHDRSQVWSEAAALLSASMVIAAVALIARTRRGPDFWGLLTDGGIV
ncbi:MAG: hypothetical protein ABIW84_10275, partial [Ilumatobacteraceae bacterium]